MKEYTFNDVVIPYQHRTKRTMPIHPEKIIGYDTETIDGLCTLLASSEDEHMHPSGFGDILLWLTSKSRRGYTGFFYNLTYDAQAILKWLWLQNLEEYWQELHVKQCIDYGQFNIFYLKGKMLSIRRYVPSGRPYRFTFYDISQFFGRRRLDDVAFEYLGERKIEHGRDLSRLTVSDMHDPAFIGYCRDDARKARNLARVWLDICERAALKPASLASPATVSAQYFHENCPTIPTINKYREDEDGHRKLAYAWEAIKGAYISVFKRGYFPHVYEYDINSAYPEAMRNLPDIDKGVMVHKTGHCIPNEAVLGWLKCRVQIDPSDPHGYHPCLPMRRDDGLNHYPAGYFETSMTLLEYEALKNSHWIGVISGVYWLPTSPLEYPYRDTITRLYNTRMVTDDPHINYFCKIMLNGWYGKHLEKHEVLDPDDKDYGKLKTGKFFNPFYASYILAWCRIKVWELLASIHDRYIIAVATDSLFTTCKLDIEANKGLGKWSPAGEGELLMVGSGVYTLREGEKVKTRNRGFRTTSKLDLFQECQNVWDQLYIEIANKRALSAMESLVQKRPQDMNKILDMPKKIDINFDGKRLWHDNFTSADDMLSRFIDSQPPHLF